MEDVLGRYLSPWQQNYLKIECQTTLELTLYLSSWRPSFGMYIQSLSTQECDVPFFQIFCQLLGVMIVEWVLIERRAPSFEQSLKKLVRGWNTCSQGFKKWLEFWVNMMIALISIHIEAWETNCSSLFFLSFVLNLLKNEHYHVNTLTMGAYLLYVEVFLQSLIT